MKQINPEFKEFVNKHINQIENILNEINDNIKGKPFEGIYREKFDALLKDINHIKSKFELYTSKFKYYTEQSERSLRKFGFLIGELIKVLNFNKELFNNKENEVYLLNIVNRWSNFNGSVKELFYNIENADYPYWIHTFFSLALVLIPFVNLISLIGGIYLVRAKDYRAIIFGGITLVLYSVWMINIIFLAV
ncbi:MAG: hypothetical protein ACTSQG_04015 [Promethearchaeota archaeon]